MKSEKFYKPAVDASVAKQKKKKKKRRSLPLFILKIVVSMIFITVFSYGVYLGGIYFDSKSFLDNWRNENGDEISIGEDEIVNVDARELSANEKLPKEWMNVLLIGGDSRKKNSYGLSDSMIIASVNKKTGEIKLTSIMRDTWVAIPGKKSKHKINSANAYGGPKLLMKTINENFDMNLTNYVFVDFVGFPYIIEKVGGVDIDITKTEMYYINVFVNDVPKRNYSKNTNFSRLRKYGENTHLTGMQALAYSRIRSTAGSDFKRTERQRNVLSSLFKKVKSQGGFNLISTATAVMPMVRTNVGVPDIISLGTKVLSSDFDNMKEFRIPMDGLYKSDKINGQAVLVPDLDKNKHALYDFIYGTEQTQSQNK